eukprot:4158197-Pyramimonas_sp.AAC.1
MSCATSFRAVPCAVQYDAKQCAVNRSIDEDFTLPSAKVSCQPCDASQLNAMCNTATQFKRKSSE